MFFFFKQKTAYEMRISDWSSDVCSSDLVEERIYRCPTPGGAVSDVPQYICGDDVYCINGDCEPIVREASTELKDALVALHAIDQAGKEFDEDDLSLFRGARETCHKPVFGLINCCAGKVSGLLSAGAGTAALAAGPPRDRQSAGAGP